MGKSLFLELISFIRPENCFFTAGIAVSGLLIFGRLNPFIAPLIVAMFLGTAGSYAYNYLGDKKEDLVNGKRLNLFVLDERRGRAAVMCLFASGAMASLFFPLPSMLTYFFLILISVLYSGRTRIKEKFILKNLNTGLGLSLAFLTGAFIAGFNEAMLYYAFAVFVLGFTANLLGDLRGCKGDKSIGMKTLPLVLGPEKTKIVIYSLTAFLVLFVVSSGCFAFYPIIPFVLAMVVLLSKNNMKGSRFSMLSSFAVLPLLLMVLRFWGGI
jgi:geranylgeranylglycerol-phosphate geranylgeranyltransferase